MQGLDIPFPSSEYEFLNKVGNFNLIYPFEHPLAQIIKINMVVRAVALEDDQYTAFMTNQMKPQEITPVGGKLLEIGYIRECQLRDIAKFEWSLNYGPDSLSGYLNLLKKDNEDGYAKVINLRNPSYSLKTFNKRYGSSARTQQERN